MKQYDLIILGGGAAGFAAAMKANELEAKTLMVNNNSVGIGGTCVNVGCLPTKHLLYIGEFIHKIKERTFNGLNSSVAFDFRTLIEEKNKLVDKFRNEKYEKVLSGLSRVEFVEGNATFISASQVQVNNEAYKANKFIIATGSSSFVLPIEGIDKVDCLTNIEAMQLKELPKSMIVLGGRALALEFAQMFSRFGTKVCLLQRSETIIPTEEPELANLLMQYLRDEGIEICTKVTLKSIHQEGNEKTVKAIVDGEDREFKAEQILMATGRRPNTSDIGLEKTGVKLGKKEEVLVNDEMQAAENLWAAGDVTGEPMLETVAAKEGMIAANNALSKKKKKMDYRVVPHAIFTDPQFAVVGLTDQETNEKGMSCKCHTVSLELVPKAQAIKNTKGAIKVVIDNDTQIIMGIHILAPQAADLIHEAVMIIKNRMTIDDVIDTLHIFPTLSEAIKLGAQSFRRDITKMSCCAE